MAVVELHSPAGALLIALLEVLEAGLAKPMRI